MGLGAGRGSEAVVDQIFGPFWSITANWPKPPISQSAGQVIGVYSLNMASVRQSSPSRWVVHLASESEADSEVTVELRMSRAMAKNLAHAEGCRIAARDPGREDPPGHVGWAVLGNPGFGRSHQPRQGTGRSLRAARGHGGRRQRGGRGARASSLMRTARGGSREHGNWWHRR